MSIVSIFLYECPSFVCPSIHLSIHVFVCLSIHLSDHVYVSLYTRLSLRLSLSLSIRPSFCRPISAQHFHECFKWGSDRISYTGGGGEFRSQAYSFKMSLPCLGCVRRHHIWANTDRRCHCRSKLRSNEVEFDPPANATINSFI